VNSIGVTINGKEQRLGDQTSLAALLRTLRLNPQHVAVEVNSRLVPRERHPECALREGDAIEIVTLVGGG
jgi:thiamine biosynthesis protein ThiS